VQYPGALKNDADASFHLAFNGILIINAEKSYIDILSWINGGKL